MSDPNLYYAYLSVFRRIYAYADAASSGVLDSDSGSCQTRSREFKENFIQQILQTAEPQGFKSQLIFIKGKLHEKVKMFCFFWTMQPPTEELLVHVCKMFPGACDLKM
ncbi:uncharacterized protein LOC133289791 [Gastrolobium bilobum]|uniref:uncharacterized protein LOC133289791 n=1 Tax=Gastrolobium bilobum TaxID=150636 RepID=UPI002AB029C9|nr:uncharacterized protein LOC133289791 [Gastrolobium bilobum]